MFKRDSNEMRRAGRWIIEVVTACMLIYLGIRHIDKVTEAVSWVLNLFQPLILGTVIALVLNVPMCPIEKQLLRSRRLTKKTKLRRAFSIILSLLLIFSIFIGIAFLVVPEIIDAIPLVINNIIKFTDQLMVQKESINFNKLPFGNELANIDIDFSKIKSAVTNWLPDGKSIFTDYIMGTATKVGNSFVSFVIGLVFSVYILYNKEKLKKQVKHLIAVWIPQRIGMEFLHITSVCISVFKSFITGQTIEAIILGTLCTVGMLILRLPYAPMVGALVGVTALIPIVGAFIGTIIGAFIILTVDPFKSLIFIIFLLILQQIEGNIIYPRVVGSSIGLPAIWVLAAITVGGRLAGPLGMFLGVPAASAAYTLLKEYTILREKNSDRLKGNVQGAEEDNVIDS